MFQPVTICSESIIETLEQGVKYVQSDVVHWRLSGVFTVNFECISHLIVVFLLLTLSRQMLAVFCIIFYQKYLDISIKIRQL